MQSVPDPDLNPDPTYICNEMTKGKKEKNLKRQDFVEIFFYSAK
jgi:hypothetical protein